MKLYFNVLVIISLVSFISSCSGKYDDAISEYIVKSEEGSGNNMEIDVKLDQINLLKKITVRDSVDYINEKNRHAWEAEIEHAQAELSEYQKGLVDITSRMSNKTVIDAYTSEVIRTQQQIDSLRNTLPQPTKRYENKNAEDELAAIVESKYTITNITTKHKKEARKNFILSPDGKTCYGVIDNLEIVVN